MGNKPSSPSAREDTNATRRNNASSHPIEEISPSQSSLSRSRRGNANVAGNRRTRSSSSPTHQMASNGCGGNGSTETSNVIPDVNVPCEEEAEVEDRPGDMSWYQMAKVGYQELVNAIIRPPRAKYKTSALGPQEFEFLGKAFKRTDFRLLNERAHVLECSHWKPHGWRRAEQLPCIVYMHGNSSARLEAVPQLSLALSLGATMVAFDFAGSGRSGGDYVSLGYYERDDLKAVVEHLRKSGEVGAIALWGRSMGAATALLHGDRDMSIAALVLDSAFADLTQLAEEMVERGREAGLTVPGFVVKAVLRMIRGSVMKTAGFNIRDLCPIAHADRTFIPALFIAGREDDFIQPHHSQQIHDAYAGDKNIVLVEGDHNSQRPRFLFDSVYIFLQNYLQVPPDWGLDRGDAMMGYPPWYHASGSMAGGGAGGMAAMYGANPSTGVETDLTDYVDWEGIALEDGVDGASDVGMTAERQAEFQTALFHMLAQERNELPAPTAQEVDGRKPPAPGPAPATASAVTSGSDKRRASPRSSSVGPTAAISSRNSAGNNTSLSSASDAGIEPDNSEDEAGVPAVAAVAIAARTARENAAARKSAAAAEAATAKAAAAEEEGGELSALGEFVAPSGVGRPAMAPFSVSDTSDFWEMDGPFSPDDGKSIPKARARAGSTSGVGGASGAAGGHNGRGSAGVVGEGEGGMGGHLLHDTDDAESFVSHDSGFGAATLNGVKGIDGKGPTLERGRQNGSFGDSYVWGGGKLVSAALGGGGASSGAIVIDAIGEWSCTMCTLINNSAAAECLACGSSRAVG